MNRIAIIPARGGSKRIPRKNIKNFLGRPIVTYPIDLALKSNLFDRVIVSTDDPEIADISLRCGAEVPWIRSPQNSTDLAPISDVILEILDHCKEEGCRTDVICCMLATAVFINEKILRDCLNQIEFEGFDSALTIQKFDYPIFRALDRKDNGNLRMFWPENLKVRSQDTPIAYHDAGQLYCAKHDTYIEEKTFLMKNSTGILLKKNEAQDIDTEEDWEYAEKLYKIKFLDKL